MKNTTVFTLTLGLLLSINSFATSAMYLSAKPNERSLIDWVNEENHSQYKIYLTIYKDKDNTDYVKRIVNKDEVSLSTDQEMNGHKAGRRAVVLDADLKEYVHCTISAQFENGFLSTFCDRLANGKEERRSYLAPGTNFIPQVEGPFEGMNQGDQMILNRTIAHFEKGTRVRVRFFFQNGLILIDRNENFVATYIKKGYLENVYSILVTAADLSNSSAKK